MMAFEVSFKRLRQWGATLLFLSLLWFITTHYIGTQVQRLSDTEMNVNLTFLLPVSYKGLNNHCYINSEIPSGTPTLRFTRKSPFKWVVSLKENPNLRGLKGILVLNNIKSVLGVTISRRIQVYAPVNPRLISISPRRNVPSTGPVVLRFDTPMDGSTLQEGVVSTAQGSFSRVPYKDSNYWAFIPSTSLKHLKRYKFTLTRGILGESGKPLENTAQLSVTTAPKLSVTKMYPVPGATKVWISREIRVEFDQPIKTGIVRLDGEPGDTHLEECGIVLSPHQAMIPGKTYTVMLTATSMYGEKASMAYSFSTVNIGKAAWADVRVIENNLCEVRIRRASDVLYSCKAASFPSVKDIPTGTLYSTGNGPDWFMLNADILIHKGDLKNTGHSPTDHTVDKMPRSYGCIVLDQKSMTEVSKILQKDAMVIIHK